MSTFYIPLRQFLSESGRSKSTFYSLCRRAKAIGDERRFKYINGRPYINISYYDDIANEEILAGELYYKARSLFSSDGALASKVSEITGINYHTVYGYLRAFKFKSATKRNIYIKAFEEILTQRGL